MRARRTVVAGAAVVAVATLLAACGNSGSDDSARSGMVSGHRMSGRSMTAGDVDVNVEPKQMDGNGAMFRVTMDTHEGSLDMDMEGARLMVNGTEWPMDRFTGDGPGGHHREGELRFMPGGPVSGMGELTMDGFDQPVRMRWNMASGSGPAETKG